MREMNKAKERKGKEMHLTSLKIPTGKTRLSQIQD